jgi:hypothetical protein
MATFTRSAARDQVGFCTLSSAVFFSIDKSMDLLMDLIMVPTMDLAIDLIAGAIVDLIANAAAGLIMDLINDSIARLAKAASRLA